MNVVINVCFGGFGLSDAAVRRYAEIKGLTLYPENDTRFGGILGATYWLVPRSERIEDLPGNWCDHPLEVRAANNKAYGEQVLSPRDIPRDDPALVQTVAELGEAASGRHAELCIVEIPDDVKWEIVEYDGTEHVAEVHRTWP